MAGARATMTRARGLVPQVAASAVCGMLAHASSLDWCAAAAFALLGWMAADDFMTRAVLLWMAVDFAVLMGVSAALIHGRGIVTAACIALVVVALAIVAGQVSKHKEGAWGAGDTAVGAGVAVFVIALAGRAPVQAGVALAGTWVADVAFCVAHLLHKRHCKRHGGTPRFDGLPFVTLLCLGMAGGLVVAKALIA